MIAIEAANDGVGEPWAQVMVDAYIALVGALCWWYGLDPQHDVYSHAAYCQPSCPGRKIDPAGPTPSHPQIGGTAGAATWSSAAFRDAVDAWPPPDTPTPEPPEDDVTDEDIDKIAKRVWAYQFNVAGDNSPAPAGSILGWTYAAVIDDVDAAAAAAEAPTYEPESSP
jgi:hypothetical protein